MYQTCYHAGTDDSDSRQKQGTTHDEIFQQSKYLATYVAVVTYVKALLQVLYVA